LCVLSCYCLHTLWENTASEPTLPLPAADFVHRHRPRHLGGGRCRYPPPSILVAAEYERLDGQEQSLDPEDHCMHEANGVYCMERKTAHPLDLS
jgi:hypothetical protein